MISRAQKLIAIIVAAIAAIAGYKQVVAAQKEQLAQKDSLITDLRGQLDASNADHAALLSRADAAESANRDLDESLKDVDDKAGDLASMLKEEDVTPTVHPDSFAVTEPARTEVGDVLVDKTDGAAAGEAVVS